MPLLVLPTLIVCYICQVVEDPQWPIGFTSSGFIIRGLRLSMLDYSASNPFSITKARIDGCTIHEPGIS